jgi:hypothetical protein
MADLVAALSLEWLAEAGAYGLLARKPELQLDKIFSNHSPYQGYPAATDVWRERYQFKTVVRPPTQSQAREAARSAPD